MTDGIATACGRPTSKRRTTEQVVPARPLAKTDAERIEILSASVELAKDITQNANEFESGFQSGWNSAIVLLQAELNARRVRCGLKT